MKCGPYFNFRYNHLKQLFAVFGKAKFEFDHFNKNYYNLLKSRRLKLPQFQDLVFSTT